MQLRCIYSVLLMVGSAIPLVAAGPPYLVTYSHQMEEPGNLEVAANQVVGNPQGGNPFLNSLVEMEYGVKAWWTTEVYLSGQATSSESSVFTGYRWENRFRPIWRELWVNPVIYVEYVDVNEADKSLREIVGHDSFHDQAEPNAETRLERKREFEAKLILSSYVKGWNISENFIMEKELNHPEPWEFGYALGVSRPMARKAKSRPCTFCAENLFVGLELYGGLGDRYRFGLHDTSHYLAPTIAWNLPNNTTFKFSPGFGLNDNSHGVLWRFTIAQEINQFGKLFRGR
jgi:hypothetical protein